MLWTETEWQGDVYIVAYLLDIYIYIYISEVEGKRRSPRDREIGFVSFVRASVRASERSCVCPH